MAARTHTFEQFAEAIDDAFGRWDLAHLHEFTLANGTAVGTPDDEFDDDRVIWDAGSQYGFVGAGGGSWYWKPLRNLTVGKRIFAYVGGAGYVGVGEVAGTMVPLRSLEAMVNGKAVKVVDQADVSDILRERAASDDEEVTEFAVPVRWLHRRPIGQAVTERGLFASQVTACKLRDERTIEVVLNAFGLNGESEVSATGGPSA